MCIKKKVTLVDETHYPLPHLQRGFTALHDACNEGHVHVVHLLLAMSADIQARTKEGWTCLMGACSNGNIAIAKILIGAGSEINATAKVLSKNCMNIIMLFRLNHA